MKTKPKSPEEKDTRTSAEISNERIMNLPLDPLYVPVPDLPIPTYNSILIQRLNKEDNKIVLLTDFGVNQELILNAGGNNSQQPTLGIIMATGPLCDPHLRVGLRCYYDCNQTGTFRHNGKDYMRMDQYCVYFIVPNVNTIDAVGVKDARQVRNEKKMPEQQIILNNISRDEMNEKDREKDKFKGKIKPIKTDWKA